VKTITRLTFLLVVTLSYCGKAFADGKFYAEKVPSHIPYQRAILIFHDNQETLILQSKFELSQSADVNSLGWVVPVPSVPEITSVDANIADITFRIYSINAQPKLFHISRFILDGIFYAGAIIVIGSIVFFLVFLFIYPFLNKIGLSKEKWTLGLLVCLSSFLAGIIIFIGGSLTKVKSSASSSNIEIVKAEKAGIYDTKVIKSENAEEIVNWLKENGLNFYESDVPVFEDYIKQKWCFVVAKVEPNTPIYQKALNGLVNPLIFKFETNKAIYPLKLTSTIGRDTEILLYTLSDTKLNIIKGFSLRHTTDVETDSLFYHRLLEEELIKNLFKSLPQSMFLCKFKDTLTPEQMKTDLVFESAPDNEPYRETKIVW
jgi:hypothetical protein